MKTISIVSIVVLVSVSVWLFTQRQSIAKLEEQNSILQERLVTGVGDRSASAKRTTPKTPLDGNPVDWRKVAGQLRNGGGGYGYLHTNRRLHDGFFSMEFDELAASLNDVGAADLSKSDREMLERKLRSLLFKNDPQRCLAEYLHLHNDRAWDHPLARAFTAWVEQDPEKAVAWFEEQLAAGSFGSANPGDSSAFPRKIARDAFFSTLNSSPETAAHLLSSVPEEKRLGTLASINLTQLTEDEHVPWANTIRTHLSKEDHLKAIAFPTQNWSDGDGSSMTIAEVSAYLDRIDATHQFARAA